LLPRLIGQGRAAELLFTGRSLSGEEALLWGFFNRQCAPETLLLYPPLDESTVYQRVLVPAGVVPASVQQVSLTEAIIELVKAGMGLSILARWAVQPYVAAGSLVVLPLKSPGLARRWTAVTLRDAASIGYIRDFIDLLVTKAPV
jgi:LysR family transcriptional regulator for metE and metH